MDAMDIDDNLREVDKKSPRKGGGSAVVSEEDPSADESDFIDVLNVEKEEKEENDDDPDAAGDEKEAESTDSSDENAFHERDYSYKRTLKAFYRYRDAHKAKAEAETHQRRDPTYPVLRNSFQMKLKQIEKVLTPGVSHRFPYPTWSVFADYRSIDPIAGRFKIGHEMS